MRRRLALVMLLILTALVFSLAPVVAEETAPPPGFPGDGPYWHPLPAIETIRPAVVGLVVERPPLMSDGQPLLSGGTGVVYKPGYLVTNAHVVEGATRVRVLLHTGGLALTQAENIWVDPVSDVAVLQFAAVNLPAPTWADSDRVKEGQMVVAVGNPLGFRLGSTATVGVVSGTARLLPGGWPPRSWGNDSLLLQTDAPINPGNDGGPLVNAAGQVVGLARTKLAFVGVEGLGFALPSNLVRRVADELIANHKMTWPWFGALLEEHPAAGQGARVDGALTVVQVAPGSPAAGQLQPGDQVLALGLTPLHTLDDLNRVLDGKAVGDPISLLVRRDGAELRVSLALAERPALYPLPDDSRIWGPLTVDQVVQAAAWAMINRAAPLAVLTAPYRAVSPGGEALFRTEFLHLTHSVYGRLAAGMPVSDNEIMQWAGTVRDQVFLEAVVRTRPADLPLRAELVQGPRTIPGRVAALPAGAPGDLPLPPVPADAAHPDLTRATFVFPSTALWANLPVAVVVRSAGGSELARFEWDTTLIR